LFDLLFHLFNFLFFFPSFFVPPFSSSSPPPHILINFIEKIVEKNQRNQVGNLLCKHEVNAQIGDGCLVGRLEKYKHQPTTKRRNGKL
jgi:hypothetical protein